MFSKREQEGYVMIDHRDSPGLTADQAAAAGRASIAPHVGAGQFFESATITCSHCQRVVVMNPDRVRQRAWCIHCDHYICDACGADMKTTGACNSFDRRVEALQRATNHNQESLSHGA